MTLTELRRYLPRWIERSVAKHFATQIPDLKMFMEEYTKGHDDYPTHIILRLDGPNFTQQSANELYVNGLVNILLSSLESTDNVTATADYLGMIAAAYTDIPIYKYGNAAEDTGEFVGCYVLKQVPNRDPLLISKFGRIRSANRITHSTVEGQYHFWLKGS